MTVPVDPASPGAGTATIALARLPATDPGQRLGSLVYDPGGPGVSGVAALRSAPNFFSPAVRARYDIVSLDPRGVGGSTHVNCGTAPYDPQGATRPLDDQRDLDAYAASHTRYAGECARLTGPLAEHVDSAATAADLDRLRAALGERTLNFVGVAYGALVGENYLAAFGPSTGRVVLDSVEDHSLDFTRAAEESAVTRQAVFDRMASWAGTDPASGLRGQVFSAVYEGLVARADTAPIPAPRVPGGQPVSGRDIAMVVRIALASPRTWPGLTAALAQAGTGDASALRTLLAPLSAAPPSSLAVVRATACGDFPQALRTSAELRAVRDTAAPVAPDQAYAIAGEQLQCVGWSLPAHDPPAAHDVRAVPPVLVTANAVDPVTPLAWSARAHQEIAGSALVTAGRVGHGTYGMSPCVTGAVDDYLLTGRTPPPELAC